MHIDQARSVYEGETLTSRWSIARAVRSADHPVVRQAAREELQTLIEETAGQAGSARIHRIARKHIDLLSVGAFTISDGTDTGAVFD